MDWTASSYPGWTVNELPSTPDGKTDHALATAAHAAAERHPPARSGELLARKRSGQPCSPVSGGGGTAVGQAPVSDAVRAGVAAAATAAYAYAGVVRCGEVASAGSSSRWCYVHARIASGLGGDREGGGRTAKGA